MNKEDFVSLECAKLLKKKGFDELCMAYYHLYDDGEIDDNDSFELAPSGDFQNSLNNYRVGAPTLYEAQKWLRQTYNIYVEPSYNNVGKFGYSIKECKRGIAYTVDNGLWYDTYEEAYDKGIIEALKLIV